ncbi:MAG: acetate uptake transporter [Sciscionella sp.]|nr:acetate uptake transporter [Sciscionella sp.]
MASAETVTENSTQTTPQPGAGIADPGPLGLAGFASTTLALSLVNAGVVPKTAELIVLPLALFFGGIAQLLAGMWEFRKDNTFGATAFTAYGAFWLAFAFLAWQFLPKIPATDVGSAVGTFLLVFTIFTAYMTLAALRTNGALIAVFAVLTLTFLFLTIGAYAGSDGLSKFGGWLGILTALLAFYTSAAGIVNGTWKRTVLPVFPLAGR